MTHDNLLQRAIHEALLRSVPESSSHLSADEWIEYSRGNLSKAAAEKAQAHLLHCADCREMLLEVSELLGPSTSEESPEDARFDRLWARVSAGRFSRNETADTSYSQRAVRFPGAAGAWAVVAAGVATVSVGMNIYFATRLHHSMNAASLARQELVVREQRISELERAAAAPPILFALAPHQQATRGQSGPQPQLLRWPLSGTVALQVEFAAKWKYDRYAAVIFGEGSVMVWSVAELPATLRENRRLVTVTLPASALANGSYRLLIYGVNPVGGRDEIEDQQFEVIR
jgi:hypothetical protein